jgi:hypothetical protein
MNETPHIHTAQSWRSNAELVAYILNKPDATDDEKLLAARLAELLQL